MDRYPIWYSRAEILHGSTATKNGVANNIRWVVNPWFVGLQPDHLTLDVPEEGTWETISQTHRDLTTLKATPSGQTNIHGRPLGKFPGSVPLNHISHLSHALVGRSRWDDPLVKREAGLVLGKDDEAAWNFIHQCRQKMKTAYKRNMTIIAEEEKAAFGRNNCFRLVERSLYQEPKFEGDFTAANISTSSDE